MRRHAPVLSAFVSGVAVMSLELLGSRIVAPYLGASILIWTNLIGIILLAMALGAWAGGVAADRRPDLRLIGGMFALAGAWCMFLARFAPDLMRFLELFPYTFAVPSAAILLLAPPAFALAGIAPAVLRLSVSDVQGSGKTAGIVSAAGTLGSLLGTYLTGYILLSRIPLSTLLYGLGGILLVASLGIFGRRARSRTGVTLGAVVLLLPLTTPAQHTPLTHVFPSAYAYVAVANASFEGEPAKLLQINAGIHAASSPQMPDRTILEYVKALRAVDVLVPSSTRMLTLGGGGFHVADEYLSRHPEADVDVVEIDPAVREAAQREFGLSTSTHLHIHLEDARPALAHLSPGYDAIIADAFSGDDTVPWYLLTTESVKRYHNLLRPDGVFAANMIFPAVPSSTDALVFVSRIVGTLRTSFAWVRAVTVGNGARSDLPSNIIVLAGNGPVPDMPSVVVAMRTEVQRPGVEEVALPEPGAPWTDGFGTADYQSLAMYREAWARLSGR